MGFDWKRTMRLWWNPNSVTYRQLLSIDQPRWRTTVPAYMKQMRRPSTSWPKHMAPSIRQQQQHYHGHSRHHVAPGGLLTASWRQYTRWLLHDGITMAPGGILRLLHHPDCSIAYITSRDLRRFEIRIWIGRFRFESDDSDSIRMWWADSKMADSKFSNQPHLYRTTNHAHCSTKNFNHCAVVINIYFMLMIF